MLIAVAFERADRCGSCVEDVDLVLVDDIPKAAWIGVCGDTFEHDCRRASAEWAVDDVAVACDPADVCCTPVDIAIVVIEDVLERRRRVDHIATDGVDDTLGFACGARGVEDEEGIFCVHPLGLTGGGLAIDDVVPPDVAAFGHLARDFVACAFDDDAALHIVLVSVFADLNSVICDLFQTEGFFATKAAVSSDECFALGVVDTIGETVGGETTEDDRVDRADTRTSEDRDRQLCDHGHVNGDDVAFLDPLGFERVGEAADFIEQLTVGQRRIFAQIISFPQDRGLIFSSVFDMAVECVVGDVGLGTFKPLDGDVPCEVKRAHVVPRFLPVELLSDLCPKLFGGVDRALVHFFVLFEGLDVGFVLKRLWGWVATLGHRLLL